MMSVRDDRCIKRIARQLLPYIVRVARQHTVRAVAKVGGHGRARSYRISDYLRRSGGVANRYDNTVANKLFNELQSTRQLRRQGKEQNVSSRRVLQPLKLIVVRIPNMGQRMRPTRPILR